MTCEQQSTAAFRIYDMCALHTIAVSLARRPERHPSLFKRSVLVMGALVLLVACALLAVFSEPPRADVALFETTGLGVDGLADFFMFGRHPPLKKHTQLAAVSNTKPPAPKPAVSKATASQAHKAAAATSAKPSVASAAKPSVAAKTASAAASSKAAAKTAAVLNPDYVVAAATQSVATAKTPSIVTAAPKPAPKPASSLKAASHKRSASSAAATTRPSRKPAKQPRSTGLRKNQRASALPGGQQTFQNTHGQIVGGGVFIDMCTHCKVSNVNVRNVNTNTDGSAVASSGKKSA
jgi:hypothetical protein